MKKTVLFLMNGFGIEQSDSYNIYNSKLMPNIDSYTQKYLFSSIQSKEYNFMEGYRMFSTGNNVPLTYQLIQNYMEKFDTNSNMKFYLSNAKNSRIQLFVFLENEKSLEHIKNFLTFIRSKCSNSIFLHVVLTSSDINNYKDLEYILTKINYDYKECKIATIIGKNTLVSEDLSTYMNLLKNEIGEKWIEIPRKFKTLANSKTAPINSKEFYVNDGFKISNEDSYFFFNYEYVDITNFINNITSLAPNSKYFSMFQVKGVQYPMFAYPMSGVSAVKSLKSIDAKALVLTEPGYMPYTNYMLNGLANQIPENISYARTDINFGPQQLQAIIKNSDYDLIIIDYHVDNLNSVSELQDRLTKLDKILGFTHDICVENNVTLFISSLYGMSKELKLDNFTKAFINFSSKVPVIVVDSVFNKSNFRLDFGTVNTLANTIYTNINKKFVGDVLIKKKGYLSKVVKK